MSAPRAHAADIPIELDLDAVNHVEVKALDDGGYEIKTIGEDPYIHASPGAPYDADRHYVFAFDYFCAKGLDSLQLFYGPPIREAQSVRGPEVLSSEGWTSYSLNIKDRQEPGSWRDGCKRFRIDFGRREGRTIQVKNIRLREPTAEERKLAANAESRKSTVTSFDEHLQAISEARYDAQIVRVEAGARQIRLVIDAGKGVGDLMLCEVPFYQSPLDRRYAWTRAVDIVPGQNTIVVNRKRGEHDRVFSSWILAQKTDDGLVPASYQRFIDSMPAKWKLTRDKPKNRKGIAGLHGGMKFQVDDYRALGVHNMTKNILLPAMVRAEPGKDTFPHEFNGVTVHVSSNQVAGLDRALLEAEELEIVTSAIILVPRNTPMSHPDCAAAGIYAMANVVEKEGWNIYAAGLDFLAQRYTRPDRKYGRITHWIMHNEVDAGWIWTNAGEIPAHTYLDLYYRSMRTMQCALRRYGNAGQVLMSLTHYWTARHNSRCYPPKQLIDIMAKRCALEGNFDWGLAYHPYPQNLRDPRTWLDTKAELDFNTPLITPKNLEVLDAYMRQKHMLYDGKVRTIVLSEQGSNSRGHDEKSYRDQAAGLVYTWLKLGALDSIESYVHHRWTDHPKEGGLNLGLRRRGDISDPETTKKLAWEIYRQLESPEQPEAVEWAKTVIPAEYFENIPAEAED